MLHAVVACARKDLRMHFRDPITLLVWIGVPLLIVAVMTLAFGGSGNPIPRGLLLVADEDDSLASSLLGGAFNYGELSKMVSVEKVKRGEGERRMAKGEASGLLIIPKGFGSAVLNDTPTQLRLMTNPAQAILPSIIRETLSIFVEGVPYLQRIAAEPLRSMASGKKPTEKDVVANSVAVHRLITRLTPYFDPLRIELVNTVVEEKPASQISYTAVMLPGTLFLTVLFLANGLSGDLWKERTLGTLRRLASTQTSTTAFLAGKAVSTVLILVAVGLVGLGAASRATDLPSDHLALGVAWIAASGAGLFLLFSIGQTLAASQRSANTLANLFMLPLAMIGGGFFPFEIMPAGMARIGQMTPNGWAVVRLKAILTGSATANDVVIAFAVALAFSAVGFLILSRRLSSGFLR